MGLANKVGQRGGRQPWAVAAVEAAAAVAPRQQAPLNLRVRFHIIRNGRIDNVGKSQSCMVSKLRIIWKQTVKMQLRRKQLR